MSIPPGPSNESTPAVRCRHWRDCGLHDGGCCERGVFDRPSAGVCLRLCQQYDGPDRGAGDALKRLITTVSAGRLRPCQPCEQRRRRLNQLIPFSGA